MNTTLRVRGVKETLREIRKLDRELEKELKDNVNKVAAPVVDAVKDAYSKAGVPLSGMSRRWARTSAGGTTRYTFPYKVASAVSGVRIRFDTRRGAIGVIKVQQYNPAASVFEAAGRKNANYLALDLDINQTRGWVSGKPSRILGPVTYKAARSSGVAAEIKRVFDEAAKRINKRIEVVG